MSWPIFFSFSFISPFKFDSLTRIFPLIIFPSAGTASPVSKYTISPTTISPISISFICPFLKTFVLILEASSWSSSKAFSLPYSDTVDINEARKIAMTIPMVSYQSKSWNKNKVLTAKAINNIFIIGSPRVAISLWMKLSFWLALISLLPWVLRLLTTSSFVSPFIISASYQKILADTLIYTDY